MPRLRIGAAAVLACAAIGASEPVPFGPSSDPLPSSAPHTRSLHAPSFAIVAWDSTAHVWGVASAAGTIATGARSPLAAPAAGAIVVLGGDAWQGGTEALAALARGVSAEAALRLVRGSPADPEARQAALVTVRGESAAYSGSRLPGWRGTRAERGFACIGYGLEDGGVLEAMAAAFREARGELGARLAAALEAGERAEGEAFEESDGDASSALLVVRASPEKEGGSDRLVDLRVDQSKEPVAALTRLYERYAESYLAAAHVRFGDAARRRGDEAEAAREYAAAEAGFRARIARAPKDGEALNELAWFLATRGGDASEALRFAEAAAAARPNDPSFLDTLAEAAYRAGNLERAIAAAERAAKMARGNRRYEERLQAFRAARAALTGPARGAAPGDTTAPIR